MAESSTIARPYAQAIFELAKQSNNLTHWLDMLAAIKSVTDDNQIKMLISNPKVIDAQLADLLVSVCAESLDQEGKNLVKVLAENGRLVVLNEILEIFRELKDEAEKTIQANVVSAFELNADQISNLQSALKNRFGCEVEISSEIDESIIGGAVIRAGDVIIDGSITTQLERLSSTLTH